MLEHDILFYAVENLKKWIQLPIDIAELESKSNDHRMDAILTIGKTNQYNVEVKKSVHRSNLPSILKKISLVIIDFPLLVAGSISKSAREVLKQENISYLDIAGNCFIKNNKGSLHIEIEGKKAEGVHDQKKHVAFNKNGIKLIYALLLNEDLINQSYSKMADAANISKSTIGSILKDLKEKKFLIQVNDKVKRLADKKVLQEKWVHSYNEKLKPSLLRGRFRFLPNEFSEWKKMDLGKDAFWGGEPAADLVTDYLSPGEWTIYTNRSKSDILKNLHLVPDPKEGNVKVYRIFWNLEEDYFVNEAMQTVNPFLIYADLIGTNDNRNFETAIKIYEQALSTHFTE